MLTWRAWTFSNDPRHFVELDEAKKWLLELCPGGTEWRKRLSNSFGNVKGRGWELYEGNRSRMAWISEEELVLTSEDPLRDLAGKILEGDPQATDLARDILRC